MRGVGRADTSLGDAGAIAALKSHDDVGVRQLVEAWTPSMLRLAREYVSSDASAEDAVQDAWITVLCQIERFERRSALRTWVLGIAINTARRAAGRERRTIPFSAIQRAERDDEAPAVDPARFDTRTGHWASPLPRWDLLPEEQLTSAELRGVIDSAIAALSARQRAVMIARDVLGMSTDEVGELYGLGTGNQRVLLHRARGKVRAAVETHEATSTEYPNTKSFESETARESRSIAWPGPRRAVPGENLVCRQLVELVTNYLDGGLDRGMRDSVEDHLAGCGSCRGYVAQVQRVLDVTVGIVPNVSPQLVDQLTAALRNVAFARTHP
ncbi:sigma-70 family RNA polymerase sigma factor [Rhodococcus sp. G-MC3]|uniref:sigma-70 family RNA polymerase sigma factor n=1 Tax=Rhodococcus sp. G-MC3 TaxID=3046209 RepID=UPI0024B8DB94|nr:sigma-70 family RNA polymerase sigma factor [Rhodococcus sp. G-MC3]MDJ0392490.1 sigma-70 family RNA polymerase sigma factor [Rhodococcus sp. G-MC3]